MQTERNLKNITKAKYIVAKNLKETTILNQYKFNSFKQNPRRSRMIIKLQKKTAKFAIGILNNKASFELNTLLHPEEVLFVFNKFVLAMRIKAP